MKKQILLTGASGTIGSQVLAQLQNKNNYNITIFARSKANLKKIIKKHSPNINIVYGDLRSEKDCAQVCKNKDYVIHLAALIPPLAQKNPELAKQINIYGTQNLLKQLENNSPNAFFIYSSSISVYGDRLTSPNITANDPLKPNQEDHYAYTKINAEKAIQQSSLDWTIFRLTAIMGNHKISKFMFHVPLETKMEICTPRDAARAFVNAIEHQEKLSKKIFNLGGGPSCQLTYKQLLTEHFKIFGLGKFNLPAKCFAEKNFPCGHYADGDELEKILKFRQDNLQTYYQNVKDNVHPITRSLTLALRFFLKKYLCSISEPYKAFQKNIKEECDRFFI